MLRTDDKLTLEVCVCPSLWGFWAFRKIVRSVGCIVEMLRYSCDVYCLNALEAFAGQNLYADSKHKVEPEKEH